MIFSTDPTKLSPPKYLEGSKRGHSPAADWICPRPRLLECLQASSPGKPVILQAPEGCGKTTLVSSWARSKPENENSTKLAWLTLDEGDNDAARFLGGLAAAFHRALPGLGTAMLAELEAPRRPDLLGLLAELLLEIAASQTSIRCVLDECQTITRERIHQALAYLAGHLPENLQLVLITSKELPEPLEVARSQGAWLTLEANDLRFEPGEARDLLATVCKVQVSAEQASVLTARTQGLVLAIHLAGLALRAHPDPDSFWKDLADPSAPALEYLLDLALERQIEPVREFLLFTSFLERLNGPLCDHVLHASPSGLQSPGRGQASLEHLAKNRFFTYSLDNERKWFRYHPILAQMLRERLQKGFVESLATLHQKASQWSELNGEVEAAIHHALEAGDEERASALIELNALEWVGRGQLHTVLSWLGRLPAGLVLLRPWLCLAEAWTTADEGWQQGTETLLAVMETAAEAMPPGTAQRALGHVAAIRILLAGEEQEPARKEELARRALELLPPQDRTVRCDIATQLGVSLRQSGRLSAAAEAFTEAIACANQGENRVSAVLAFCRLADLHFVEGLLQKSLALSEEALFVAQAHHTKEEYPLLPAGLAHFYAGAALYERDELETAQSHFENSIAFCETWGVPEYVAVGQARLAETLYARGNLKHAQNMAAQAEKTLENLQWLNRKYHLPGDTTVKSPSTYLVLRPEYAQAKLAALYLAWNDIDKASAWLYQNRGQATDPVDFSQVPVFLSIAQVLLAQKRVLEARRLVRSLVSICETAGAQHYLIRTLSLQAQLMQQSNDYQSALATLKRALLLAEPENYIRTFFDINQNVNLLLKHLSESGPGATYARTILAAIDRQARRAAWADETISLVTRPPTHPLPPLEKVTREMFTDREMEVLHLLDSYLSVVEIAFRLSISHQTVETLVRSICRKLSARDANQAVARARELRLL